MRRSLLTALALGALALSGCEAIKVVASTAAALDNATKVTLSGLVTVNATQLPAAQRGSDSGAVGLPSGKVSLKPLGGGSAPPTVTTGKDGAFTAQVAASTTYEVKVEFTDDFRRTVTLSGLAFPAEGAGERRLNLDAAHNMVASKALLAFPKAVGKFDFDTAVYRMRDLLQTRTPPSPVDRSAAETSYEDLADENVRKALKAALGN
jgi:hypothetical protein